MAEYVNTALFVFDENGELYREDLTNNEHGCSISAVSIEELRENSATILKDTDHVVVAALLPVVKELFKLAIEYGFSIGVLPLDAQKALRRCYRIPEDRQQAISLALETTHSDLDIVFCNDQIVLFKSVVGWVPLIDNLINASKFKIVTDAIQKISSLHLLPFTISTFGKNKNEFSTAACGCVILENPELSFASSIIGNDCSFEDSMISAVIIAPFSITDYLKLLWLRIFTDPISSKLPSSVGHIKTPELLIKPTPELDVIIDGVCATTTPAHYRVQPDAIKINHGVWSQTERKKGISQKEKFAVSNLPDGKELVKTRHKRVPIFTYASEERFKDLFIALRDDAKLDSTYVVLMLLSTILATTGLYLNSSSVIIGAMLLAPLMAPIISLSMSLLRYDRKLFKQSFIKVCVGIGLALWIATMLALISPYQPVTDEMQGRLHPSLLDLVVAIVAGVAGAYTKSFKEILQSLAGVAIAVALVPPLAVAGIGLGRFDPVFFGSAFLLFITNLIGIVLSATITFRVLGYSPVLRDKRALYIVLGSLLMIAIPLSLTYKDITERAAFEKSWEHERFLVNGKYLIVNDAVLSGYQGKKILIVDVYARELLDRKDLSEFKRKVQRNFSDDPIIRAKVTYIP